LIAAEAGAVAQRFDDDGLHVAAPPHLFDPLLALVRPPGPPT
jgi:hypothetical protein